MEKVQQELRAFVGQTTFEETVRELIEKKSGRVLKKLPADNDTWQVTYIFFARSGYTQTAHEYARQQGIQLVTLSQMMSVLDTA